MDRNRRRKMEDDSSLVIHQFIDKYDDSSFKMSKKSKTKPSKRKAGGDSPVKRKRRPKPPDMPRRPLSAYNIYFQEQRALIIGKPVSNESVSGISRAQLLPDGKGISQPSFTRKKRAHRKTHGKISFANLAKQIGASWNSLNPEEKKKYENGAAKEKARYQEELRLYRMKKDKEEEDNVEGKGFFEDDHTKPRRTEFRSSMRRKAKHNDDVGELSNSISPSGLTIEYMKKKKPFPSRLRGRRYRPMSQAEKSMRSQASLDQICPLPLTFDATRCHPSEIVSETDMLKAVSPLLKTNPPVFRESTHQMERSSEDKASIPSIQTAVSNISACSLNSNGTGNDTEMADILTFFLKDGEAEKHIEQRNLDNGVCAIEHV